MSVITIAVNNEGEYVSTSSYWNDIYEPETPTVRKLKELGFRLFAEASGHNVNLQFAEITPTPSREYFKSKGIK